MTSLRANEGCAWATIRRRRGSHPAHTAHKGPDRARGQNALVEDGAVPIRDVLEAESAVFGAAELKDIVTAFEAVMKDMGLTDRTDPGHHHAGEAHD
jgi:hypothetical protein